MTDDEESVGVSPRRATKVERSTGRGLTRLVEAMVEKSIGLPGSAVDHALNRIRRRFPSATDEEMLKHLERWYVGLSATGGAVAGGAAAAPVVGLGTGLVVAGADLAAFGVLTATYVLGVASIHGVDVTDHDRRRLLLLTALTGPAAVREIGRTSRRKGGPWGNQVVSSLPTAAVRRVTKLVVPRFMKRYGRRQGVVVLGELVPLGMGVILGAAGSAALARGVVRTMRAAFDPVAP